MLIDQLFKKPKRKYVIEGIVLKKYSHTITKRYKHYCPWLSRTSQTIYVYLIIQDKSGKIIVKHYCDEFPNDEFYKIMRIHKGDIIKVWGCPSNEGSKKSPNIRFLANTIKLK